MTGTNQPTSGFPTAETLTGDEIVGIVQSGSNVRTTVGGIASYTASQIGSGYGESTAPAIGKNAFAASFGAALGYYADARESNSIAIGLHAYSAYENAVTIGSNATGDGAYGITIGHQANSSYTASIAIGRKSNSSANYAVAIGYKTYATNTYSVAVGSVANANGNESIAVGRKVLAANSASIAIGYETYTYGNSVSIGSVVNSTGPLSVAIGFNVYAASYLSVNMGTYLHTNESFGIVNIGLGNDVGAKYGIAIGVSNQAYDSGVIAIGAHNLANENYCIAIGYRNNATGLRATAIGYGNNSSQNYAIAIGSSAQATGVSSICIGRGTYGSANYSIAIGSSSTASNTNAIAIGANAYANSENAMAIGQTAKAKAGYSIAMGDHAYATGISTIAIGGSAYCDAVRDGIALGTSTQVATAYGIAIGSGAYARSGESPSIAIGPGSQASGGGVAIGDGTSAGQRSIAFGYDAVATVAYSVALLGQANGNYSLAIGVGSNASYDNAIAFGNGATSTCDTDFTVRGGVGDYEGIIAPSTHAQKLFGTTLAVINAVATWSGSDWNIYVTNNVTTGTSGNSWTLNINDTTGTPDVSLTVITSSPYVIVTLATDSDGNVITTLDDAGTALTNAGYGFTYNGGGPSTVVSDGDAGTHAFDFSGGVDAVTPVVLTADGTDATSNNLPTTMNSTVSRMSGQVVGYYPLLISGQSGDSATFTLEPTMVIRDNSSNYTLVGPAIFTLETSTEGAAEWTVPTLTINDSTQLYITVTGEDTDLNWIGFFSFESTQ